MRTFCAFACVAAASAASSIEWYKVQHDKRLPAELRAVNEGVANDGESWLFSNKHMLYRAHKRYITIEAANHDAIPEDLRAEGFNHIGDIDYLDGYLYGGMEGGSGGAIGLWNATDLSFVKYTRVEQNGVSTAPACSVDMNAPPLSPSP